jgi:hypothetical protein
MSMPFLRRKLKVLKDSGNSLRTTPRQEHGPLPCQFRPGPQNAFFIELFPIRTLPLGPCEQRFRRIQSENEDKKLLALGSFSHDPGSGLTGARSLAFVRDELFLDIGVCILGLAYSRRICGELGITVFTHAKHRKVVLPFDDPKLAFRHAPSFPQAWLRLLACGNSNRTITGLVASMR